MIDVKRMIAMMNMTYQSIVNEGVLKESQKPKPQFSGDDELTLNIKREGIILTFDRKSQCLININLILIKAEQPNYRFSNNLPNPLKPEMTKEYVYQAMGKPYESKLPIKIMGRMVGGIEHFRLNRDMFGKLSLLLYYTADQSQVKSLVFMNTNDVSWGEQR